MYFKMSKRVSTSNKEENAKSLEVQRGLKSKLSSVKKTFLDWSEKADINCYTKMFDYKGNVCVQSIWFVVLLLSTGATFFLIAYTVIGYLTYDVTSQIRIINEIPITFPTITFCDNNPFSTLKAQEFMQNISQINNLAPNSFENISLIFNLAKLRASSKLVDDSKRQTFGQQMRPFFCKFKGKPCAMNDFQWYWSFEYGNCYQFNSVSNSASQVGELKELTRPGSAFGLELGVFPLINQNSLITTSSVGGVVFVHESKFKPSESVFLETWRNTLICIKKTFTQKYPSPYSDCIDLDSYKSDLYKYITSALKKAYRQQDCVDLCQQRHIIDECKCYYTKYVDLDTGVRPCLNKTDYSCVENSFNNFNLDECQTRSCPLECDSTTFDLSLSSLEYPDEKTYEFFKNAYTLDSFYSSFFNLTLSYDLFKSNVAYFTVFYPNLQYTEITESPKTDMYTLLTQIGGSLGMFVSFSIFTLFELVEIAILCLKDFFYTRA